LLTGMIGISLPMQWPLTSKYHGSVSQREQLDFFVTDQTPCPSLGNIFTNASGHPIQKQQRIKIPFLTSLLEMAELLEPEREKSRN
jgi:hypothetical protein